MITPRRLQTMLLFVIATCTSCFVLYFSGSLFIPILLAAFLAIMIQPVLEWFDNHVARWLGLFLILALLTTFLLIDSLLLTSSLFRITEKIPTYTQRLQEMLQGPLEWANSHGIHLTWKQLGTQKLLAWSLGLFTRGLSSTFSIIGQVILILFVLIFLMMESKQFETKIRVGFSAENSEAIIDTIRSITRQIQQYIVAKTIVSLITAVCTIIVALLFGLDFPLLWGTLAFLLNYIPNIGSMIAVIPPIMIAFLQFKTLGPGMGAATSLILVQTLVGNFLDPRIVGHSIRLSPLIILLSMIFWGWMWGVMGMLLAVPITVSIKIICEHTDNLKVVAILLSEEAVDTLDSKEESA